MMFSCRKAAKGSKGFFCYVLFMFCECGFKVVEISKNPQGSALVVSKLCKEGGFAAFKLSPSSSCIYIHHTIPLEIIGIFWGPFLESCFEMMSYHGKPQRLFYFERNVKYPKSTELQEQENLSEKSKLGAEINCSLFLAVCIWLALFLFGQNKAHYTTFFLF